MNIFIFIVCQIHVGYTGNIIRCTCSCKEKCCHHAVAVALRGAGFTSRSLKLSTIIEYLGKTPNQTDSIDYDYGVKTLKRAENSLLSDHLKSFSFDGTMYFRGKVLSSMKQILREVEVSVICDK